MGSIGRALSPGLGCPKSSLRGKTGDGALQRQKDHYHVHAPGYHYHGHARADEEAVALLFIFIVGLFFTFFVCLCTADARKQKGSSLIANREGGRTARESESKGHFFFFFANTRVCGNAMTRVRF